MNIETYILWLILLLALALLGSLLAGRRITVFEHERGLLYRNGIYQRTLGPGSYWVNRISQVIQKVDVRARPVTIVGQEVLSADNVSIKVSLAVLFRIADPYLAVVGSTSFQEQVYLQLQVHLRDLISAVPIEELLEKRKDIGGQLLEVSKEEAARLGIELLSVGVRDIMFPGDLKNIFAQVVNARHEGLAALERARGESAALRSLANTAKLLENNPALYQLRLLQALGSSSGNSILLASTPDGAPIPLAAAKPKKKNP
jgi:regulator of protease activity HflC (stomatin/prohibitin superfamily)